MKKVFLVKKDVTKPYGKDNWQIMTLDEFKKFWAIEANKSRRFLRLFDYDSEGTVIYREYEGKELSKRRTELSRNWRKLDYINKHNIKEVPFTTTCVDDETVSSEQLIVDETEDVEEIVHKQLMVEKLREAIKQLTPDEQRLVQAFYFNSNGKSARQSVRDLGLPWSTATSRMETILKKLRNFF